MKKIASVGISLIISVAAIAQKNKVQSAWNALKFNELDKAKAAIDMAAENDETKNDPKMWYYRGKTYLAINDDKDKYKNLDADAAEKAYTSFLNCLKADKDKAYTEEVTKLLMATAVRVYNRGIDAFQVKDYEKANRYLNSLFEAFPYDKDKALARNNITVESLNYDLYKIARTSGDRAKAKECVQKLIDVKYKDPSIYMDMSRLMLEEKDTAKALSYVEMGRNLFEDNTKLINAEMALYIAQNKIDILLEKTTRAIAATPDNEMLHFIQGSIYEGKNESAKAEAAYKKALELKPDYAEANFNMGILHYNRGGDWNNKANGLPLDQAKKAKEYDAKASEEFKSAMGYLEKAHELNPADKTVVQPLLKIYRTLGENDKYNQLKESVNKK